MEKNKNRDWKFNFKRIGKVFTLKSDLPQLKPDNNFTELNSPDAEKITSLLVETKFDQQALCSRSTRKKIVLTYYITRRLLASVSVTLLPGSPVEF